MGVCPSASPDPNIARSREVDKAIATAEKQQEIRKLLLLGAGESGKSTLFKQMKKIYGKGFTDEDRNHAINVIAENVVTSMRTLLYKANNKYGKVACEDSVRALEERKVNTRLTPELGQHIKRLWKDPGIQNAFQNRSRFQLNDSAAYFFDRIEEITSLGYVPNEQDILRSRMPTTGIVENTFHIDGNQFRMLDVGGQRSERRKWIHCFDGVTAVLFVASLSEYDQVLYEDDEQPRMLEALELFEEMCNSQWFENTSMILFLNKRDIFAEKIQRVPIQSYFPTFHGADKLEEGAMFFQNLFEEKNRQDKAIYTHVTCATDTNNVQTVFTDVKDIVIRKHLRTMALMFHPWNGRTSFQHAEPSSEAREMLSTPANIEVSKPLLSAMLERQRELQRERRHTLADIQLQVAEEFGFEDLEFGVKALQDAEHEESREVVIHHRNSLFQESFDSSKCPFKQFYVVV